MSNWLILVIVIITVCLIDCIVKNITDTIKTKYEKKDKDNNPASK